MIQLTVSLETWVLSLPECVQRVVRERPPSICYRSLENDGHFWLEGVKEKNGVVLYSIIHGSDSFLPGFLVDQVDPNTLIPCDCGQWERPSAEKIIAAVRVTQALLRATPGNLAESEV